MRLPLPANGPRRVTLPAVLQAAEAYCVKSPASIAGGRHEREQIGGRLAQPGPLIAAEEEQAVGFQRAAERAAKLVATEAVVRALAGRRVDGVEAVGRVEPVIADELEEVAVERVGARLGHRVDRGAGVHAVAGRRGARFELELLQRVGEGQRQVQVVVRVVVGGAVEHVGDAKALTAGDGNRAPALHAAAGGVERRLRHRRARQRDQVHRVAAVERQRLDALVLDHLADARAARFDQRRGGLHGHRLGDLAERERDVDLGVGVDRAARCRSAGRSGSRRAWPRADRARSAGSRARRARQPR